MKFAGPLQSWGTNSHFETRATDLYPSKSGVIGLLSASLGYSRSENEKIKSLNELDFGVRVDQEGKLLNDYHTAQKIKKTTEHLLDRTYVTNRYYLEDAIFLVGLSGEDSLINDIEQAIKNPCYQQFLGRRSCPLTYDFIVDINNKDLLENFKTQEWLASKWYKRKNNNKLVRLEAFVDSHLLKNNNIIFRRDNVISFSQKERKFAYRSEGMFYVDVVNNQYSEKETKHDFFRYLGDENVYFKNRD